MDQIRIDNLEVFAHHGVYEDEKKNGQLFYLNVVLYTDTRKAGKTDRLEDATNYGQVCHLLTQWMQEKSYDLLEAVAEMLAGKLLNFFPLIGGVDLEIRKPQAPIGLPFESVSVKIHRQWHKVYLSIGSNMGDRKKYLQDAVDAIQTREGVRNVKVSPLLETKPYGGVEQNDFLNGAVYLETTDTPAELLEYLHKVEALADRRREVHWGPRTLDLDILFYDKLIYEDEALIIPHVDLQNREFVLKPMCQLAPNLRHPILLKTMEELLREVQAK